MNEVLEISPVYLGEKRTVLTKIIYWISAPNIPNI